MHISLIINKKTREVDVYDSTDDGWERVPPERRKQYNIPLITKCIVCDTLYYINEGTSLYLVAHKYFKQNNCVWGLYPHNCPSCREHIVDMMRTETGDARQDTLNLLNKGRDFAKSLTLI